MGVAATRRSRRLPLGPVGHLSVLDLRSAQTTNRSPSTGSHSGPAGRSAVPDIAGTDGDHTGLHLVEMSTQHSAISRRKVGPAGHADDDHPISENRRLLLLVSQAVYAAKAHEQRAHYQEQQHPVPAPT